MGQEISGYQVLPGFPHVLFLQFFAAFAEFIELSHGGR
jgi:hypothetical protein